MYLNREIIEKYEKNQAVDELVDYLKTCFVIERNSDGNLKSFEFDSEMVNILLDLFKNDCIPLRQQLFRVLRNYVTNPQVADYLYENQRIINLIETNFKREEADLRILLQFLSNFLTHRHWGEEFYEFLLPKLTRLFEVKVHIYETSALLHNISVKQSIAKHFKVDHYDLLFEYCISDDSNEFLEFLINTCLTYDEFWEYFTNLKINSRITVLQFIRDHQISNTSFHLPEVALNILVESFNTKCPAIIQSTQSDDTSALEVALLLDVISALSSDELSLSRLQNDKNFLINVGAVLINVHNLSKLDDNCFTKIERLNEIRVPPKEIQQHPAFGFKAGLIRIIGNLCWKNKIMQDLVRTAELIPVILDCCNMDARNPYIMQWVIFAIRNLCENNRENQALIAGMHRQGTVSSTVLQEMGLTLHGNREDRISIVPLDSIRK